jgi:hypothetical protein
MNPQRSSEIQKMMRLVSTCQGFLRSGDIDGLEQNITILRNKRKIIWNDKPDSGYTNYLVYGVCTRFMADQISSGFLHDIKEKTDERLNYLNHLNSEIENLEISNFKSKGIKDFHAGKYESAFSMWKKALRKVPSETSIHPRLSDFLDQSDLNEKGRLREVAIGLRRRYCFEEDIGFWQRLESCLPDPAVRCIDFDDDGAMYLNCVNRHSVVKLNSDEEFEWEVCFEEQDELGGKSKGSRFSSFCVSIDRLVLCDASNVSIDRLVLCDASNRQLIFLNKDGVAEKKIPLQVGIPLFVQYVEDLGQYHITDEKTGKVIVFNDNFREIGGYKSPDDALRPVQLVRAKGLNKMVLASSLILLRSTLDVFDLDGNHENTIASFSDPPCHVVKLDLDNSGFIYAADHFGRIHKISPFGEVIWSHRENQQADRFKYVKYHSPHLYVSDFLKMRRFTVDR